MAMGQARYLSGLLLASTVLAAPHVASAQDRESDTARATGEAAGASADEILVTARRRDETSTDVPVMITAFSGAQLAEAGAVSVPDIARMTPQLELENNVANYGGSASLRGVGGSQANTAAEPAITVNVDGIPIGTNAAVRLGQLDLGQAEILKGPQALFFGKNSSGGIVALKGAEPTREFEAEARASYDLVWKQLALEGYVSGPLTDTLGVRVAGRIASPSKFWINDAPGVAQPKGPLAQSVTGRFALRFQPSDAIDWKVKLVYDDLDDGGTNTRVQRILCPRGVPQGPTALPSVTDCKADRHFARGDWSPNLAVVANDRRFGNGVPKTTARQSLAVSDLTIGISDAVKANLLTGLYDLRSTLRELSNRGPIPRLVGLGSSDKKTFSQEARLYSDGSGPFQWMLGGFYSHDKFIDFERVAILANAANVTAATVSLPSASNWRIISNTYSAFAQGSYEFLPGLTLSAGARYSEERKKQSVNLSNRFPSHLKFNDFSPEITLSYKPADDTNIYLSYKEGYKSGGFHIGSLTYRFAIPNPAITVIDNTFDAETVKGVEGGIKTALFDNQLRLDVGAYYYRYSDLQLGRYDPTVLGSRIDNISASNVRGAEASFTFRPDAVPGLRLTGALNYNLSTYAKPFLAACWVGQSVAQGCTIDTDKDGRGDAQDFKGKTLPYYSKWAGNFGIAYDIETASGMTIGLNTKASFHSRGFLEQSLRPGLTKPASIYLDAGLRVEPASKAWELALIGKNLTNRIVPISAFGENFTGNAAATGTTTATVLDQGDFSAVIRDGRSVMLRATVRFHGFGN